MSEEIFTVDTVELSIAAEPLTFEAAERASIDAAWAVQSAANPALWNGSFFLFDRVETDPRRGFLARARPTDFATFLHWRAAAPDGRFTHIFPVAAITTRDDRLLLGVMGRRTANAGLAYPPSGSFDDADRVADRLDPEANIRRELAEEVGLDVADLVADPIWWAIRSGPRRFALVRRHRSPLSAAELGGIIARHMAADTEEELSAVRFVPFDEPLPATATVPYVNRLLTLLARD